MEREDFSYNDQGWGVSDAILYKKFAIIPTMDKRYFSDNDNPEEPLKILIADDNPIELDKTFKYVQKVFKNVEIVSKRTVSGFRDVLNTEPIDILFLDERFDKAGKKGNFDSRKNLPRLEKTLIFYKSVDGQLNEKFRSEQESINYFEDEDVTEIHLSNKYFMKNLEQGNIFTGSNETLFGYEGRDYFSFVEFSVRILKGTPELLSKFNSNLSKKIVKHIKCWIDPIELIEDYRDSKEKLAIFCAKNFHETKYNRESPLMTLKKYEMVTGQKIEAKSRGGQLPTTWSAEERKIDEEKWKDIIEEKRRKGEMLFNFNKKFFNKINESEVSDEDNKKEIDYFADF